MSEGEPGLRGAGTVRPGDGLPHQCRAQLRSVWLLLGGCHRSHGLGGWEGCPLPRDVRPEGTVHGHGEGPRAAPPCMRPVVVPGQPQRHPRHALECPWPLSPSVLVARGLSVATRLPQGPRSPKREAWEGVGLESWVRASSQSSWATSPPPLWAPLPAEPGPPCLGSLGHRCQAGHSRLGRCACHHRPGRSQPPKQGLQRETPGGRPFSPFRVPELPWPVHSSSSRVHLRRRLAPLRVLRPLRGP